MASVHHQLDLSKLQRRKPDIRNATCSRYDWKQSQRTGFYAFDRNRGILYSHVGSLAVHPYGDGYLISLGYWVDWSGTTYEGWEIDSTSVIVEMYFETDSAQKAKVEAERLYGMYMVPLLLRSDTNTSFEQQEYELRQKFPRVRV